MPEIKKLIKRLTLSDHPVDWSLAAVSVDWTGEPLLLYEEGKPPRPPRSANIESMIAWLNCPAKRHHLIHWQGNTPGQVSFENSSNLLCTTHTQPFGDGWLLGEGRGGTTRIYDKRGNLVRILDLGDASEHVLTTPEGYIWVAYFDEGVFGNGIASEGLVCFDSGGEPIFKFNEFAQQRNLPFISDCYTLNVSDSSVWVSYYTDFPLIHLKDFKLDGVWIELGSNKAIAVRGDRLVIFPAYCKSYLTSRTLENAETKIWELADPEGIPLSSVVESSLETESASTPFRCVARGDRMYVYDDAALYELRW